MKYQLDSNVILLEIDRIQIADITPGDVLDCSFGEYVWTEQDSQFMESNPEAGVYLQLEKRDQGKYVGKGIRITPAEVNL